MLKYNYVWRTLRAKNTPIENRNFKDGWVTYACTPTMETQRQED